MKVLFTFLVSFFLLSPAFADVQVKDYEALKNTEDFKTYIGGIGNGYSWANAYLISKKGKEFYCAPPKLALTQENYLSILRDGIKEKHISKDDYIEMILLLQLIKTFPCK